MDVVVLFAKYAFLLVLVAGIVLCAIGAWQSFRQSRTVEPVKSGEEFAKIVANSDVAGHELSALLRVAGVVAFLAASLYFYTQFIAL